MPPRIAIIYGPGPGTGAAIARAFAPTHNLVLLSRSLPGSLDKLDLTDVERSNVVAATYDGTPASIASALDAARAKWPEAVVDLGVVHANSPVFRKGFLDIPSETFREGFAPVFGAWDFSQSLIRAFLSRPLESPLKSARGTLIFTSATASLRGGGAFSASAPGSFARRALSQSLAREFGPQGIHVAHVVIDGFIDTPRVREAWGVASDDSRMNVEDIAAVYVDLYQQRPSAWTQELDIRPYKEKW